MNFYKPVLRLAAEYEKRTDWLFKLAWEYIPIIKITGKEGKKQAAYRAVSDAIELAPDEQCRGSLWLVYPRTLSRLSEAKVNVACLLAFARLGASLAGKTRKRRRAESG